MTTKTPTWEEQFEKTLLATKGGQWMECSLYEDTYLEIKDFIRQLIEKERQKWGEELLEKINKLENPCEPRSEDLGDIRKTAGMNTIYNQALQEIKTLIKNKLPL